MKSNLNAKVSNLTEEVQKLNTNFEPLKSDFCATRIENDPLNERLICLGKAMLGECQVFKTGMSWNYCHSFLSK